MKKRRENNTKKNFLKENLKGGLSKYHKEYLGITISEGYFAKSKILILDKIKEDSKAPKKQVVFWLQPPFRYMAAASLVFVFGLTVWLQNANKNSIEDDNIAFLSSSDVVLINSLFVEDAALELFADATLINEIIIKVALSEQKMNTLFLNSLLVEDSLIDNYTSNKLLEIIIL